VHGALAVLVVAEGLEGQREQLRPLLLEHRGDLALGRAVDAGVGPALLPAIEVGLRRVHPLEAKPAQLELRVPDARLALALAIGMLHPARQRRHAVVRQEVAIQRVEGRVDVGLEHTLLEVVEHDELHGAAQPAEGALVQLCPDARARLPGEQADRLAAVAERHHEQPRAAVLARLGMPHHRAVAVVDLRLLAGPGLDYGMRLARRLGAPLRHEAPHARVAGREAVVVDQVLPDRHGRAAAAQRLLDPLAVGLAGARLRATAGRRWPDRVGGHLYGRFCRRPGVGGRLFGRFWRRVPPATRRSHRDPRRAEVATRRLATHAGGLFDAPK
jgi:hypothetical protein